MTNESTLILLKCKLHSLKSGLQKAKEKGCSREIIKKWEMNCLETEQKILDLDQ